MERPILSLFERRRRRLIIERQPYTPCSLRPCSLLLSIHRRVREEERRLFLSLSQGHRGEGGSQWKFKFQLFSSRREASPLAHRAATLTSTVSTKPNELEWRNTTSFPPYALSPRSSPLLSTFLSSFISNLTTNPFYRHVALFSLGCTSLGRSGGGRGDNSTLSGPR